MSVLPAMRAAQYLRKSTDLQPHSLALQAQAIAAYAARKGLSIVRTYEDAGVSGLEAGNRAGLQSLLADVVGGAADYQVVLVYDVSRWGRFQNPDEGAHYEFVCRQEGVAVEYCAEDLGPGGVGGALVKQVKRVMAAEYSRHLSDNVRRAKRAGASQGYWTAARPGYGLQRCVVDEAGRRLRVLARGEPKPLRAHRVVLTPGPPEEVAVVREIYRMFLDEGLTRTQILTRLNTEGPRFRDGRPWLFRTVTNILTNPVYVGDIRYGRLAHDLKRRGGLRPREDWIEVEDAFEACVPRDLQRRAAARLALERLDDRAMLDRLAQLLAREGRLTSQIIARAADVPHPASYHYRFGSLSRAYELIGYSPARRASPKAPPPAPLPSPPRAAQYLRMSTARQPESMALQAAAIADYAAARGYEIARSYEDPAISGVDARRRPAFRELLARVLGGKADFEAILVYDVSRWGRFQDPDEAAHYEFLCAQEGVRIEYCAEAFGSGRPMQDALMKSLKRVMAAEFSRELGLKVRAAQRRNSAAGYWQHGSPGYGLRRRLVDGPQMAPGERKADKTRHTVLVAGPAKEVETVRRIFRLCAEGWTSGQIARVLNEEGVPGPSKGPWRAERVRKMLANPKYAGDLVTQRRHTPLGGRRRDARPEDWVVAPGAAPALAPRDLFEAAQARLKRREAPSDEVLLARLREVFETHGMASEPQLRMLGVPWARAYRARFGSLRAAYAAIGAERPKRFPKRMSDEEMLRGLARLFLRAGDLAPKLIDAAPELPSADHYRKRFGTLAAAYARIGFVRITPAQARSALGQARLFARRAQIARWADLPEAS